MKNARWQFSLRQLLVVMTGVAIVTMLVSHQWRLVVGLATLTAYFLDAFGPAVEGILRVWLEEKRGWRPHKPSEREILEFNARYPAKPRDTPALPTNSSQRGDSLALRRSKLPP
jgi:hypothetical protein